MEKLSKKQKPSNIYEPGIHLAIRIIDVLFEVNWIKIMIYLLLTDTDDIRESIALVYYPPNQTQQQIISE